MADLAIDLPVNWDILGNPINWLIVVVILVFVSYGMYVVWENSSALVPNLEK